jgi:hypothetical protein
MQSYSNMYQDYSVDNSFDYGRRQTGDDPQRASRSRRSSMRRAGKVSAFNGIHRRRNKRWSW